MKKILIFSLSYYPVNVSGAEGAIKEITDRINPNEIEFHMITMLFDKSLPRNEKLGNINVYRIDFGSLYLSKIMFIPLAVLKAFSLNKKHKFDAIWSMMTYMLFPVALMRIFGSRIPHILTLQDGDPYDKVFKRLFIKPFVPLLDLGFRTASIIQVISSYLGEWPEKRGYKGEIVKIYNGANPRDVAADFDDQVIENLKKELGKKEGDIFLVNTARLVYQKAANFTIQALKMLPENVKFLAVGGGDEEKMLKDLVKELELEHRVIFTGMVDRSVVSNYRKVSDIFVGPSRSEGLGNAFLSAMATKLPVISTRVGGIKEFLFDKKHNPEETETGWVVDVDSPEQIVEAVKDILADSEKVARITEDARAMVLRKFNWDMIAVDMKEKVFDKVTK